MDKLIREETGWEKLIRENEASESPYDKSERGLLRSKAQMKNLGISTRQINKITKENSNLVKYNEEIRNFGNVIIYHNNTGVEPHGIIDQRLEELIIIYQYYLAHQDISMQSKFRNPGHLLNDGVISDVNSHGHFEIPSISVKSCNTNIFYTFIHLRIKITRDNGVKSKFHHVKSWQLMNVMLSY